MLLSSRRWRTRCSSPNARASPRMDSRTSSHRRLISPFYCPIHCPPKSLCEFADSACPPTQGHVLCFQQGGAKHLSLSILYIYISPNTSFREYTHQIFTFLHLFCSSARLQFTFPGMFEIGTCVSSSYERRLCVYILILVCICMRMSVYYECVYVWVCNSGYICVRALSSRAKTLRSDKRSLI